MTGMFGQELGGVAGDYLGGKAINALKTHKQRANQPRSRGPSMDPLRAANLGTAADNLALASIDLMRSRVRDNQAPSPMFSGSGLHETGTIGRQGTLITDPYAMSSQPYSANFQFRNTLPPAYANISKRAGGKGLYAQPQSARGLFASGGEGLYAGNGLFAGSGLCR
jgi:hypothetical protein